MTPERDGFLARLWPRRAETEQPGSTRHDLEQQVVAGDPIAAVPRSGLRQADPSEVATFELVESRVEPRWPPAANVRPKRAPKPSRSRTVKGTSRKASKKPAKPPTKVGTRRAVKARRKR